MVNSQLRMTDARASHTGKVDTLPPLSPRTYCSCFHTVGVRTRRIIKAWDVPGRGARLFFFLLSNSPPPSIFPSSDLFPEADHATDVTSGVSHPQNGRRLPEDFGLSSFLFFLDRSIAFYLQGLTEKTDLTVTGPFFFG